MISYQGERFIKYMNTLSDNELKGYKKKAEEWNPMLVEYANARVELLIAIDKRENTTMHSSKISAKYKQLNLFDLGGVA